jgi:hypothetical protein
MAEASAQDPSSAQTTELCLLVDLEARWENLRIDYQSATSKTASTLDELQQKQKAYATFLAALVAYNKKYKPTHVPDLLLNDARRLKLWCRKMRELHVRAEHSELRYPVHLMEKAYHRADRLADRIKIDHITRRVGSDNIQAAIGELESLVRWCDSLVTSPKEA